MHDTAAIDAKAADVAEAVLKAAGSNLGHYEAYSRKRIIEATRDALNALPPQQEAVGLVTDEMALALQRHWREENPDSEDWPAPSLSFSRRLLEAALAAAPLPAPPASKDQQ